MKTKKGLETKIDSIKRWIDQEKIKGIALIIWTFFLLIMVIVLLIILNIKLSHIMSLQEEINQNTRDLLFKILEMK